MIVRDTCVTHNKQPTSCFDKGPPEGTLVVCFLSYSGPLTVGYYSTHCWVAWLSRGVK